MFTKFATLIAAVSFAAALIAGSGLNARASATCAIGKDCHPICATVVGCKPNGI